MLAAADTEDTAEANAVYYYSNLLLYYSNYVIID